MSMEFRDEVVLGLECCIKSDETGLCPAECQVRYKYGHECETGLKRDALELLKEQEPKLVRYTASTVRCPNCNKQITTKGCIHRDIKYCWKCGQAVKWDE